MLLTGTNAISAALDRLEGRRTGAQRARPFNPSFEAAATAEQIGAGRQHTPPHVLDGDRRRAHVASIRSAALEVLVELPGRDLPAVRLPLEAFGGDEPLREMVAQARR